MKHSVMAVFLVITAGIWWVIIGVFTRCLASYGFTSLQITSCRAILTTLMLAVYCALREPSAFRIHLKDLWCFLGSGLLSIVFFNVCYFLTIEASTLSTAAIMLYTAPCFVILFSAVLFHEKITVKKCAALVLAFSGCALTAGILGGSVSLSLFSFMTGIGSGLGYALYSIFSKIALRRYDALTVTFWTYLTAGVGIAPFCGLPEMAGKIAQDPSLIWMIVPLALVCTLIPSLLYTKGLTMIEAGRASVMAFVEPLTATICGIALFGEQLTPVSAAGIALIFVSILILNIDIPKRDGQKNVTQESSDSAR